MPRASRCYGCRPARQPFRRCRAPPKPFPPVVGLAATQPIVMLPIEDGVALRTGGGHHIVSVGHLLLLPRKGDWSVAFQRDMRAVVMSVTSDAFHGRKIGKPGLGDVRILPPGGFTDVFARMLEETARHLDTLSDLEWTAAAQNLANLLPIFM